jgi:hypothetical protein
LKSALNLSDDNERTADALTALGVE